MSKILTVKFPVEQPKVKRDKKGNVIPGPTLDEDAVRAWLHEQLEPQVRAKLGEQVELRVVPGRTFEIRPEGLQAKAVDVREIVGDLIGEVMGEFDAESFMREPA